MHCLINLFRLRECNYSLSIPCACQMVHGWLQVLAYTTQDVNRTLRLNSQPVTPAQEAALFKFVEKSTEHSAGEHTL